MQIKTGFLNNSMIPRKYTRDGENVNPDIEILGAPYDTKSFVIIVDDPDAPSGDWVHWLVWNIPSGLTKIRENSVPGIQGVNDFQLKNYKGPSPPFGVHRYFFKVYALNSILSIDNNSRKADVERTMQGKIIEKAQIIGLYGKS